MTSLIRRCDGLLVNALASHAIGPGSIPDGSILSFLFSPSNPPFAAVIYFSFQTSSLKFFNNLNNIFKRIPWNLWSF